MTLWAIVPVKPLNHGKSRLSSVLSSEEREQLNKYLLTNTLSVLNSISEIEQVLVISRDSEAISIAREAGARTVMESGAPQLNLALARATIIAKTYSTRSVLILPIDLPLITQEDIHRLLEKAYDPPVVVIAPDRKHKGTNALLVNPAGLIEYEFGPDSFQKHCERARAAGARLEVVELSSIALDLDQPEDLEYMEKQIDFGL